MGRDRRARDVVRGPVDRPNSREMDAYPDLARRRRTRGGSPGTFCEQRAVFASTGGNQPTGVDPRDCGDGGVRGLGAVHTAGLTTACPQLTRADMSPSDVN